MLLANLAHVWIDLGGDPGIVVPEFISVYDRFLDELVTEARRVHRPQWSRHPAVHCDPFMGMSVVATGRLLADHVEQLAPFWMQRVRRHLETGAYLSQSGGEALSEALPIFTEAVDAEAGEYETHPAAGIFDLLVAAPDCPGLGVSRLRSGKEYGSFALHMHACTQYMYRVELVEMNSHSIPQILLSPLQRRAGLPQSCYSCLGWGPGWIFLPEGGDTRFIALDPVGLDNHFQDPGGLAPVVIL